MDNLIKPHPRDELIVRAEEVRTRQLKEKEESRNAKKAIRRAERKKWEEEDKLSLRYGRKRVYESAFRHCIQKYLKLDRRAMDIYLCGMSNEQLKELEDLLYEMARKRLWLGWAWRIAPCLMVPIFGWFALFGLDFGNKTIRDNYPYPFQMPMHPKYRFVTLRDWYRKEFGQISYDDSSRRFVNKSQPFPILRD